MVAPAPLAFRASMSAVDAVVTRDPQFVWATLVLHNMTDVVSFFRPEGLSPTSKPSVRTCCGGVSGPCLVVAGAVGTAVAPSTAHDQLGVAGAGLLRLGARPVFICGGRLRLRLRRVVLPFLALFKGVPMFSRISHAYRFSVGVSLGLCMLLAWTIRSMNGRRIPGWAAAAAVVVLRIGESTVASPAPSPFRWQTPRSPKRSRRSRAAQFSISRWADRCWPASALPRPARTQPAQPLASMTPCPRACGPTVFCASGGNGDSATTLAQLPWFDLAMGRLGNNRRRPKMDRHARPYPAGQLAEPRAFSTSCRRRCTTRMACESTTSIRKATGAPRSPRGAPRWRFLRATMVSVHQHRVGRHAHERGRCIHPGHAVGHEALLHLAVRLERTQQPECVFRHRHDVRGLRGRGLLMRRDFPGVRKRHVGHVAGRQIVEPASTTKARSSWSNRAHPAKPSPTGLRAEPASRSLRVWVFCWVKTSFTPTYNTNTSASRRCSDRVREMVEVFGSPSPNWVIERSVGKHRA